MELKNLRPQLYSAAEYCEKSYLHKKHSAITMFENQIEEYKDFWQKVKDYEIANASLRPVVDLLVVHGVDHPVRKINCDHNPQGCSKYAHVKRPNGMNLGNLEFILRKSLDKLEASNRESITFKFDVSDRSRSMHFTAFTEECKKLFRLLAAEIFEKVTVVLPGDTRFGTIARDLLANHFLIHEFLYQGTRCLLGCSSQSGGNRAEQPCITATPSYLGAYFQT
uniref:Uncharacterized protein n=1 Tax=Chenopodium quinoa TaxID=63459 RepID=A0A803KUN7_CHEQI